MMAMRKALRGGSVWLDHSASFRDRDRMLIPLEEWKRHRDHHTAALGHTDSPDAFLEPLLENIRVGLASVADALSDGKLSIDAHGTLHLPALEALDGDVVPKRTGKAIFEAIGEQQLPDILLEADASTGFSEALLGHRASSTVELLACYAALLAHGTEIDAKGVAAMIPSLKVSQVSAAMRSLEAPGRLRRANERVTDFQRSVPLAALWGPGELGTSGTVRGVPGNGHPYRDPRATPRLFASSFRRRQSVCMHVYGCQPVGTSRPDRSLDEIRKHPVLNILPERSNHAIRCNPRESQQAGR